MNTTTILTRLALAGIASGMLAVTACDKEGKAGDGSGSAVAKPAPADSVKSAEHGCKGLNACKGQGGCSVSESDLKAYAAKAGIPLEKAGKPHGCKGQNECKGLGGCKH
jgi:hypothetical protein